MTNRELIHEFYTAFARHDHQAMAAFYHDEARFTDPAFGTLNVRQVRAMWRMLIERSGGNLEITFRDVEANESSGSAVWEARYIFGQTGRPVLNIIRARFEFTEGKIHRHYDEFSLWRWSRQALGLPGLLIGYTGFFRSRLQKQTRKLLDTYMESHG
jgi:ketosteroid isomerase-like protein